MELIRAFIAIELSEEVKASLTRLQDRLGLARRPFVKWVAPEGIHLTLKFLGNIAPERLPQITEALTEAARGIAPFGLHIGGLGAFPNFKLPRVAWVGVGGDVARLGTLQRRLDQALVALGFPVEARPFSPHLTLGRIRQGTPAEERKRFGELIGSIKAEGMFPLNVDEVNLMRSKLTPSGAIYSRLASLKLGDYR